MENISENLVEADKSIRTADHMIYVTFPLIKDKRLLLKILQEIKKAVTHAMSSMLQFEYYNGRIKLYKDSRVNFKIFLEKCVPRYQITKEEVALITELLDFVEKQKESPFEFGKEGRLILLSGNLRPRVMSVEKTKEFMFAAKSILRKTKEEIFKNG
jgi:hypothetical protein